MKKLTKLLVVVLALAMVLGVFSISTAETKYITEFNTTHVANAILGSEGKPTSVIPELKGEVKELTIAAGYGFINLDNFDESDIKEFTFFLGIPGSDAPEGSDLVANAESNGGTYQVGFQRWQWRGDKTAGDCFIIITALEDCFVDVWTNEIANQWATNMVMTEYVVDPDGVILKVRETNVKDANDEHAFFDGVHLQKGDRLVIQNGNGGYGPGTNQVWPQFKVDAAAYDATKRADFETVKALVNAKLEAYDEIDAAVAALKEDDYSSARWSSIGDIASEAKSVIADLMSEEEITATVTQAKADIDAVLTKAEEAEQLQKQKDEKKAALAAEYKEEWYTKKNWELVKAALDKAYAAIDAAKNVAGMNTAMTVARTEIAEIEVGGCGTTKQAEAGIVLGGLAAAIVVFTKKRED